jgi:hypothetical protein
MLLCKTRRAYDDVNHYVHNWHHAGMHQRVVEVSHGSYKQIIDLLVQNIHIIPTPFQRVCIHCMHLLGIRLDLHNYPSKLLRMSKIMVRDASHSIMGVHETQKNFPVLNAVRSRERKAKQMLEENQTILKRIVNTKFYYSSMEWNRHAQNTYHYIGKKSVTPCVSRLLRWTRS